MHPLRRPAWTPPPPLPGVAWGEDPGARLVAYYQEVAANMADLPFYNSRLTVAALPFCRVEGDWLGVVWTPWFLNAFLLPGGGTLWQDLSQGERRRVALPVGEMDFLGDQAPALGPFQYCPLVAPVEDLTGQEEAAAVARQALDTLLLPVAAEGAVEETALPGEGPARGPVEAPNTPLLASLDGPEAPLSPAAGEQAPSRTDKEPARRGFLKTFLGQGH